MIKRGSGDIVVTCSLAGYSAIKQEPVYSASKWAITCFTQTTRRQVNKHGIRVSQVSPGPVTSALLADWSAERLQAAKDAGALIDPSEVADAPAFVVGYDDVALLGQPIERCRRYLGIAKHVEPSGKGQVGGDGHRRALLELRQQAEQHLAARLRERQKPSSSRITSSTWTRLDASCPTFPARVYDFRWVVERFATMILPLAQARAAYSSRVGIVRPLASAATPSASGKATPSSIASISPPPVHDTAAGDPVRFDE